MSISREDEQQAAEDRDAEMLRYILVLTIAGLRQDLAEAHAVLREALESDYQGELRIWFKDFRRSHLANRLRTFPATEDAP